MRKSLGRIAVFGIALALSAGLAAAQSLPKLDAPTSECPCFTQAQIEAIPTPYEYCTIQNLEILDNRWGFFSNIVHETPLIGAQIEYYTKTQKGECLYLDYSGDPWITVQLKDLTVGQATACRQYILNVIEANYDQCLVVYDIATWERPR